MQGKLYINRMFVVLVETFDRKQNKFIFPSCRRFLLYMFHSSPKISYIVCSALIGSACSTSGLRSSIWINLNRHIRCKNRMPCQWRIQTMDHQGAALRGRPFGTVLFLTGELHFTPPEIAQDLSVHILMWAGLSRAWMKLTALSIDISLTMRIQQCNVSELISVFSLINFSWFCV